MSETRGERTYAEEMYHRAAHLSASVHIDQHTDMDVDCVRRDGDHYVVLQLGGGYPAKVNVFLHAPELERLHDVVHEALAELGHATVGNSTHEAYAAGWDAALAFVQTATDEPVLTDTPVVPIGIG
jgi:hypothetical protein